MFEQLFTEFLTSEDTLRVYEVGRLIYKSKKERLLPLMEYLAEAGPQPEKVTIFDKVMGNAAALLSVKAGCSEVWSPLGSELAKETFKKYEIVHHLNATVPYITQADGKSMCPMEKLSISKEPEEFYRIMRERLNANTATDSG